MLLGTLAALGVVLLATGLWLTFRYAPGPGRAWTVSAGRQIHRFAGYAFAVVAVLVAVDLALRVAGRHARRAWTRLAASVVLVVAVGVALVSGPKLAWNQLALQGVTVGTSLRGVFQSDAVKFVLVDGGELSLSSFHRWAWVHILVVPLVIVASAVVLMQRTRRNTRNDAAEDVATAVS